MDRVQKYKTYRRAGKDLNAKLPDRLDDDALIETARTLGMTEDHEGEEVVVHEGEEDMAVMMDFALNEYNTEHKTAVDRYYEGGCWDNDIEKELLEGLRQSHTSLFEITSVVPEESKLELQDLLNQGTWLELTDLGLSSTANLDGLIFFRPVELIDFTMTSGFLFPFASKHKGHLLSVHEEVMKRTGSRPKSHRRFVIFNRLYRKYGSLFTEFQIE